MPPRKSAAAGLVQPSVGVRLFVAQSSGARGRAGGTSDHFHPSVGRHEGRHKQSNGQFRRKDFFRDAVCAIRCPQLYFQCPREQLARYFTPKSTWRQEAWLPNARMKRNLERMNRGTQDPKFKNLVVILLLLQTPNLFFFFLWMVQARSSWDQPL